MNKMQNIPHLGRNTQVISLAFEHISRTVNRCKTSSIIMIQHHSNWAQTNLQQFTFPSSQKGTSRIILYSEDLN
jgi:hypothetical protein